jgi:hypothetical protein
VSRPSTEPLPSSIKDLWKEAFQKLSEKTQQELQKLGKPEQKSQPIKQQIDDLVKVAKTRQEECVKKYWVLPVGKHRIVLRDYVVNIVGCLEKIGEVAIQFAPPQASIPWAAFKVVMQVSIRTTVHSLLYTIIPFIVLMLKQSNLFRYLSSNPSRCVRYSQA